MWTALGAANTMSKDPAVRVLREILKAHETVYPRDLERALKALPEIDQVRIVQVALAITIARVDISEAILDDGPSEKEEKIHEC